MSDSELAIMRGGPLHRRVYWLEELPSMPSARHYEDTGEYWRIGDVYYGLGKAAADRTARVWLHRDGPDATSAGRDVYSPPTSGAGGFARTCTRLGCTATATHCVYGDYDRPWYGCDEHYGAMAASFKIGRSDGYYVHAVPC